MLEIKEYEEKFAKELSKMILENLYTINIKDQGKAFVDKISVSFTEEAIKNNFPKRTKCFVAVDDGVVIGTGGFGKFVGDETGFKYIVMSVFVNIKYHGKGIGRKLLSVVEQEAKKVGAKELHVVSSVYGCDFYMKLGFNHLNGIVTRNEDNEYLLVKHL